MKRRISEQTIGLALLLILVGVGLVGLHLINRHDRAKHTTLESRERKALLQDSIRQSIALRDSMRAVWAQQKHERDSLRPIWEAERLERQRKKAHYLEQKAEWEREKAIRDSIRYAEEHIEIVLCLFDPNTADSTTLVHLGLRPWMARSLIHYREKGGYFRQKSDFRKLYGMTDSLYATLEPYITILPPDSAGAITEANGSSTKNYLRPIKKDTILDLNTADTTALQYIRGIGSYTARRIVRYRSLLGGFYSVEQLRDLQPPIRNIDSILPAFIVDTVLIQPLRINLLSVDAMVHHPYLSFDQAVAIRNRRHRKGPLRSFADLLSLRTSSGQSAFTPQELDRLKPYLSFEK